MTAARGARRLARASWSPPARGAAWSWSASRRRGRAAAQRATLVVLRPTRAVGAEGREPAAVLWPSKRSSSIEVAAAGLRRPRGKGEPSAAAAPAAAERRQLQRFLGRWTPPPPPPKSTHPPPQLRARLLGPKRRSAASRGRAAPCAPPPTQRTAPSPATTTARARASTVTDAEAAAVRKRPRPQPDRAADAADAAKVGWRGCLLSSGHRSVPSMPSTRRCSTGAPRPV